MSEKSREKRHTPFEPRQEGEAGQTKAGRNQSPKPHWPTGLKVSPSKDITCFIPEHLAVILSREAFEQLFAYAYSTTNEVCCLGTVRQEEGRFRIEHLPALAFVGKGHGLGMLLGGVGHDPADVRAAVLDQDHLDLRLQVHGHQRGSVPPPAFGSILHRASGHSFLMLADSLAILKLRLPVSSCW